MVENFKWYFRHGSKKTKFTWKEMHHFYTGIVLIIIGFIGLFEMWPLWIVYTLIFFGFWNIIDDIIQHLCQRVQKELTGCYTIRSFLHWCFYPKQWKNKI